MTELPSPRPLAPPPPAPSLILHAACQPRAPRRRAAGRHRRAPAPGQRRAPRPAAQPPRPDGRAVGAGPLTGAGRGGGEGGGGQPPAGQCRAGPAGSGGAAPAALEARELPPVAAVGGSAGPCPPGERPGQPARSRRGARGSRCRGEGAAGASFSPTARNSGEARPGPGGSSDSARRRAEPAPRARAREGSRRAAGAEVPPRGPAARGRPSCPVLQPGPCPVPRARPREPPGSRPGVLRPLGCPLAGGINPASRSTTRRSAWCGSRTARRAPAAPAEHRTSCSANCKGGGAPSSPQAPPQQTPRAAHGAGLGLRPPGSPGAPPAAGPVLRPSLGQISPDTGAAVRPRYRRGGSRGVKFR